MDINPIIGTIMYPTLLGIILIATVNIGCFVRKHHQNIHVLYDRVGTLEVAMNRQNNPAITYQVPTHTSMPIPVLHSMSRY